MVLDVPKALGQEVHTRDTAQTRREEEDSPRYYPPPASQRAPENDVSVSGMWGMSPLGEPSHVRRGSQRRGDLGLGPGW